MSKNQNSMLEEKIRAIIEGSAKLKIFKGKTFFCETCEKYLTIKNKERHLKSKYHKKRDKKIQSKINIKIDKSGGDIQKSITESKLIPKFLKTPYGELHLPGHNGHKFHNFLGQLGPCVF